MVEKINQTPFSEPTGQGMVYFVGAGPGDPELITVRGRNLLTGADLVLYAGSLVSEEILAYAPKTAVFQSSAGMKLDQQIALITEAVKQGSRVVRLHTGDPSIYGAIAEQMAELDRLGILYRVIPGVSSAFAAAAALAIELTIPDLTQTVILTRLSGRTDVPELEKLAGLAAHKSSLMVFLSAGMVERVIDELLQAGYTADTPVAVAYRVTWPDQKILHGTLGSIAQQMLDAEITHHALIVISPALGQKDFPTIEASHLYGSGQDQPARKTGTAIVCLTRNGIRTGLKLLDSLPDSELFAPKRYLPQNAADSRIHPTITSIRQTLQSAFQEYAAVVAIMASGIVVRELAPLLQSKHTDPGVVIVDEAGQYAISLLSGHKGGANQLARAVARILGGQPVITTASDTQGLPALDLLQKTYGWVLENDRFLTATSAAMVNNSPIAVYQDCGDTDWLPSTSPGPFQHFDSLQRWLSAPLQYKVAITYREIHQNGKCLIFHPQCLHVGVGCNRSTPLNEIWHAIVETFTKHALSTLSIASLATVSQKADEPGLLLLSDNCHIPLRIFTPEQLSEVPDLPNPSHYAQQAVGAPGVAEPAALLAAGVDTLMVEKHKFPNVTVAVAIEKRAS